MNIQTTLAQLKPARIGWGAVAGWLATFISFPIGGVAALVLIGAVDNAADGLIGGAAAGLVIGLGQWLVLRQTHAIKAWWIAASSLGMGAGLGLAVALFGTATGFNEIVMRAIVTGGLLGLAQAMVLSKRLSIASLWTFTVTASFTLAWIVSSGVIVNSLSNGYTIFGTSGAILFQLITGLLLLLVLPEPVDTAATALEK